MEWLSNALTVANLINALVVFGVYAIRTELHHIRESIDNAKECAVEAKAAAAKANERIDFMLETRSGR